MSKILKECEGSLKQIDTTTLGSIDFCTAVKNCPSVMNLKNGIAENADKIKNTNKRVDEVSNKTDTAFTEIAAIKETDKTQSSQIGEVNANISMLKKRSIKLDKNIQSLQTRVVLDETNLNFQDWCQNVYIPTAPNAENKYARGDFYLNVSNNIGATNAAYINIRALNSTAPYTAADWQLIKTAQPSDILNLLGIDPIEVSHPDKHQWVISIEPRKLEKFLSELIKIDFTNVEIVLKEVFGKVHFNDDATFAENVKVNKKLTAVDAHVEDEFTVDGLSTLKFLTVTEGVRKPIRFYEDVTMQEDLTVDSGITAKTLNVTHSAVLNNVTLNEARIPWYDKTLKELIDHILAKIN